MKRWHLNAIHFKQRAKGLNNKARRISFKINHENFPPYHLVYCLLELSCMLPALHIFVKAIARHDRQPNSCDAKHRFLFEHNTISAILIFYLMRCRSFAGWLQNMLIFARRYWDVYPSRASPRPFQKSHPRKFDSENFRLIYFVLFFSNFFLVSPRPVFSLQNCRSTISPFRSC